MKQFLHDLSYAWRQLRKSPGFAFVAVLTLALGIGANTAIFSVMDAVVLRYFPVPNPQQLVYLLGANRPTNTSQTGDDDYSFTEYSFEQLRGQRRAFSDLMAFVPLGLPTIAVRYGDEPEEARGDMVSGNFFSGLGVAMERGRGFTLDEEARHAQVAVLSYDYWTRRFGRNPAILGDTLYVKGVPFTMVGIARPGFTGVEPVDQKRMDFWIPLQNRPDITAWGQADQHDGFALYGTKAWWCLMMIGRLEPGVTAKQAQAQLNSLFRQTAYWGGAKQEPKRPLPELHFSAARGNQGLREGYEQPLELLMAMVGLVLVIACSNVAMLLMARNAAREREFSLRLALGASRRHLFRKLLTESVLLVGAGAGLGWLFAEWSTKALASWSEFDVNIGPDRTVLLFTLGVSLVAALVFGLAPLRSAAGVSPGLALKTSAAASSQDKKKLRGGHVVVALQVSLCLVLLVGAGLLLRTLRNLETANLGLQASGLLTFGITPPQNLRSDAETVHFFQALTTRLRTLPGVESVTLMQNRIGSGWSNNTYAYVDGVLPIGETDAAIMRWNTVGADYFHVLRIPLLLGRDITDADTAASAKVVVVNHTFADRFLAGRNPIGHRVAFDNVPEPSNPAGPTQYTIVGVAADSKYRAVDEQPRGMAYFPYAQVPGVATMHFDLRTAGSPADLLPQVRTAVHDFGLDLPLLDPMTQQEQFDESFTQQRLFSRLATFFGLLAALLVATGLYGTLAYRVSRRTAEIGVRMALGAQRRQVLWMVLRECLAVTAAGAAIGLPFAFAIARVLRSTLFGLGPSDPLTFAAALLGMAAVTLASSLIPARRAASVDPMQALRSE
jgi:predicted permease